MGDDDPALPIAPETLLLIVFTSGTTRAPKGVLNSQGRLMMLGWGACQHMCQATVDDVIYGAMPLYHANAQVLALAPPLVAGASLALARRFSASRFLADVRRHGATLFNYVGNPLAYIMETPARPDDADNPLRLAYGNEAPRQYIAAFAERFGCQAGTHAYIHHPDGEGEYFDVTSVISPTQLGKSQTLSRDYPETSGVYGIDERRFFLQDFTTPDGVVPELRLQIGSADSQSFAVGIEKLDIQHLLRRNCPPCDVVDLPADNAEWSVVEEVLLNVTARSNRPDTNGDHFRRTISVGVKPRNLLPQ